MSYIKVYKYKLQASIDQGETWEDTGEYAPSGDPIGYYDTLEECMAQYRTIQSGTTCVGVDKHNQDVYEVSYDNGVTWSVVSTSAGTLIEADSPDCGYTPGFNGKYKLTLDDTSVVSAECDSSSSVTSSETQDYRHEIVSVEIGDCVTTIDDGAFFNEYMISSVTIGNNVTSISEYAFTMCTELSEIVIPDNVTSIGYAAFAQCTVLTSITISCGIISIGESAFEETSPRAIIINATTPPTLGANAFRYTDKCPIYVPCASVDAYKAASGWSEYRARIRGIQPCTLPPKYVLTLNDSSTVSAECNSSLSVTSGDVSSQYSGSVVSAVIGDCVSNIGQRAFSYSSGLTSVTLSDSVTSLSAAAFSYCSGLTSIDIPDSVTKIGGTVFTRCFSLTSVTIGSGCTAIGQQAFYNCTALTSVTIEATTPPTLGSSSFNYTNNCPIYVPASSVNTYKSASGWSTYASRIQAIP